jgi:hypothetical protein
VNLEDPDSYKIIYIQIEVSTVESLFASVVSGFLIRLAERPSAFAAGGSNPEFPWRPEVRVSGVEIGLVVTTAFGDEISCPGPDWRTDLQRRRPGKDV